MDNNGKNFYQLLQVQPDAPADVIKHNYRILLYKLKIHPDLGGDNNDAALVNIAFETLSNVKKRAEYDQLLFKQTGFEIFSRPCPIFPGSGLQKTVSIEFIQPGKNRRNYYRMLQVDPEAHSTVIFERYKALLNQPGKSGFWYDLFREAYFVLNDPDKKTLYDRLLKSCRHIAAVKKMQRHSPLFFSEEVNLHNCRCIERMKRSCMINVFIHWSGEQIHGCLQDISPKGLRFTTDHRLEAGQVVKIHAEKFRAVAEVVHRQKEGDNYTSYGVIFHTVFFDSEKGNFVMTTA